MGALWDTYLLSAAGGFLYIVVTAGFGFMNAQGDAASAEGGGDGDLSSADSGGDGDFSTADGGADGDFSSADGGGDLSTTDVRQLTAAGKTNLAHVRTATNKGKRTNIGLLILKICSPTTIAMFGFSFGFAGLLLTKYLPMLGYFSLIPATISGVIGYKFMCYLINWVAEKLYSNASYTTEQIIGKVAEVTVPISAGHTGEIIYLAGKVRSTAPAQGATASTACSTSSRVMITDVRDGVFIVEPCVDEALLS